MSQTGSDALVEATEGWFTNPHIDTQSRPLSYLMKQTVRRSYGGLANAANPIATLLFTAQTAFWLLI